MTSQSKSPESRPDPCPVCHGALPVDPSHPIGRDVQCPSCFAQIGFVRLQGEVRAYPIAAGDSSKLIQEDRRILRGLIPEETARQLKICPLMLALGCLYVACRDSKNTELRAHLEALCGHEVELFQWDVNEGLEELIGNFYRNEDTWNWNTDRR